MLTKRDLASWAYASMLCSLLVMSGEGKAFETVSKTETISRGKNIAAQYCSTCHAIEERGTSPLAEAPAFAEYFKEHDPRNIMTEIDKGIAVGHHSTPMPVFQFSAEEANALVAYLKDLTADTD